MFEFLQPISDSLGLSLETCLIICSIVILFTIFLIINQVVASLSDTKRAPTTEFGLTTK